MQIPERPDYTKNDVRKKSVSFGSAIFFARRLAIDILQHPFIPIYLIHVLSSQSLFFTGRKDQPLAKYSAKEMNAPDSQ